MFRGTEVLPVYRYICRRFIRGTIHTFGLRLDYIRRNLIMYIPTSIVLSFNPTNLSHKETKKKNKN